METLPSSLEDFIATKLVALSLVSDESTASFVQGIIEEDSFEAEDKIAAILGVLELGEGDEAAENTVKELIESSTAYREEQVATLKAQDEEKAAAKAAAAESGPKKVLTPEEELAKQRALIKSYELLDEQEEAERRVKSDADKAPSVVFLDPKLQTKKARKKAEAGMDILMQPNINAAAVAGAQLQRRQEDAAAAAKKKERDKGDMKKQKDDAAKKAEDKKKKAQKGERRA